MINNRIGCMGACCGVCVGRGGTSCQESEERADTRTPESGGTSKLQFKAKTVFSFLITSFFMQSIFGNIT